jgi:hypothetical protein
MTKGEWRRDSAYEFNEGGHNGYKTEPEEKVHAENIVQKFFAFPG